VNDALAAADKIVHPVETQWHYKLLVPHGFVAETKEGVGLVRGYRYNHPDGRSVRCCTGANADYWESNNGGWGYWSTLEKWANGE
jgi:hypothetical protein